MPSYLLPSFLKWSLPDKSIQANKIESKYFCRKLFLSPSINICILFLLFGQAHRTEAHVTLTFPEARFPPLDFLDTARTMGPCGVPKSSRSLVSNFQVGQTYNISWRMQYPHQGGYRLQLLKPDGTILEQLAPKMLTGSDALDEFAGLNDQTAESQVIKFSAACTNCTLMLERQALEWGKAYRFRSCAELNVLDEIKDDCSGKSTESRQDSKCQCEKNFSGDHCQYEDDCTLDSDCKNGGKCLTDSIQANRKSCFCAYGFFGMNCEKKSFALADDTSESFSCFAYNELLDKESSFSYGMFNTSCYKKVELNSKDLLYSRVVKNHVEIILDFETESYVALGWRPLQIPTTCRLFPDLAASLATGVNEADRRAAATAGYLPSALNSPLHPMDCTDIIMASVSSGSYLHIEDMYTRDRSTPLSDSWLDGEQSLSSAYGLQVQGRTVVMFRRLIREIEPTDHPLGPGKIFVIHAKGQTAGSYQHSVPSAIEQQSKHANVTIKNRDFYRNDQWKYHGSENRGINKLELVSAEEMAKFRSPLVHIHPDQTAASPNVGSSSRRTGEASSPKTTLSPQPEPEPYPSTSSNSQPTKHRDPQPEPEPEPQPEPKNESEPSPNPQPEPEPQPEPKSNSLEEDQSLALVSNDEHHTAENKQMREKFVEETLNHPKYAKMRNYLLDRNNKAKRVNIESSANKNVSKILQKIKSIDRSGDENVFKDPPTITSINEPIQDMLIDGGVLLTNEQIDKLATKSQNHRQKRQLQKENAYNKWNPKTPFSTLSTIL